MDPPGIFDCKVLDGAVFVHGLPTNRISTFSEYTDKVFIPHLQKHLQDTRRIGIVWDTYISGSVKESTREKRRNGIRRKVSDQAKLPGNWLGFLRDPENKKELFNFQTGKVAQFRHPEGTSLHITLDESVLSQGLSLQMGKCNHEEADMRIVVHIML